MGAPISETTLTSLNYLRPPDAKQLILLPPTQRRPRCRAASRSRLRFNEARASAWRFRVSSRGHHSIRAASVVCSSEPQASPRRSPPAWASGRLPPVPGQGHVAPRRRRPASQSPGPAARAAQQVGARPSTYVPPRGVEEPLVLVPFLLLVIGLGFGVTVAEGAAAPLTLAAAGAVTEAVAGRVAACLRPPGRAPLPRTRFRLGSGSPRGAQHSAAQRAHGPRLPGISGGARQGAQRTRSPAMARPPPVSARPACLHDPFLTRSLNRCRERRRLHSPPRPPRLCARCLRAAGPGPSLSQLSAAPAAHARGEPPEGAGTGGGGGGGRSLRGTGRGRAGRFAATGLWFLRCDRPGSPTSLNLGGADLAFSIISPTPFGLTGPGIAAHSFCKRSLSSRGLGGSVLL